MTVNYAFAYIRVSGPAQCAEGRDGLRRQRDAVYDYAINHGMLVEREFSEEGVTGTKDFDERPALRKMLESLKSGEIRDVVIERVDRLARDLVVQEDLIRRLQSYGVTLHSTMEPDLCSNDPTRIFIRQVLGAVAQLDRTLIVRKTKAARDHKRATTGRCEGRKPYGFRPGENFNVIDIQNAKREGMSAAEIARSMNVQGVKTRYGKPWSAVQVKRILSRPQTVPQD